MLPRQKLTMEEYRESVINAKVFANEFYELCKSFRPPVKQSNAKINSILAKCNENIIDFLVRIKNSIDDGRCDVKTFNDQIIKRNTFNLLDIEIWWYLKKCDIMGEDDFYQIFDATDCHHISHYFSECLCKSIFQELVCSPFRKNMNCDLIELLLNHKERCDLKNIESPAYHHFITFLSSYNNMYTKQDIMITDSIIEILKMSSLKDPVIKLFLQHLIEVLLHDEQMRLDDAFSTIEHFIRNENLITKANLKMFEYFDSQDIISCLKQVFSKSLNWQNLFNLLSCMASYYEDRLKHFKALIQYLLEDALENLKKNPLLYVFALARYCSSQKLPQFPSYLNWFSSTFSSESSRPINTKEKAVFFMNFLNETVEYDQPYYLKVHINRAPCLPIDCQSLVSDYVKLVKTRLIDLNETAELGLFDNVSTKTSAEFDVETVLNIFSNTNEVPKCVLEASLFCRAYYEKKFLVTLLSKYEGTHSARHRLITKLQSLVCED